jgi:hypothetical protein
MDGMAFEVFKRSNEGSGAKNCSNVKLMMTFKTSNEGYSILSDYNDDGLN